MPSYFFLNDTASSFPPSRCLLRTLCTLLCLVAAAPVLQGFGEGMVKTVCSHRVCLSDGITSVDSDEVFCTWHILQILR